ncbi:YdeI/OmpD-associated family protein [Phototrophicus methaneseepsis]|uniref:YdeI/OmpD-associated family protein n=1 Tax=Phototrophicus methaneseepsis TaxID=2710758 RepID=A0A7S8E9K2_9CHLR|nr:YdeI/OmpD-associated family protein [Phototrophicus methaneseepsis]QPC82865.1 YdeI/OmpD-associated family protein [Phototrophicus methaneseepsis]
MTDEVPIIAFETETDFEQWLVSNHADAKALWMKIAKKASPYSTIDYQQALTLALCYGWIDGVKNKLDENYFLQRFTPRRPKSKWSRINREKAEVLMAEGRMHTAGLNEVEQARADGRWDAAYESSSRITVPEDFQAMLDEHPQAQAFFDTLSSTNRYAILYRLSTVKKEETRQRNMAKFLAMLLAKETIY